MSFIFRAYHAMARQRPMSTRTGIPTGRVNRISVAVLVDGSYSKNEKGEMVYQERSKDQLERIATLVRSAIGFDQKRGDQVEVVNLKFAEAPAVAPITEPTGLFGMLQFTKDDRDVFHRARHDDAAQPGGAVHGDPAAGQARPGLRSDPRADRRRCGAGIDRGGAQAAGGQNMVPAGPNLVDVAQVQDRVHAQTVHRVGELAERNPSETANIVRQWLAEPAT